MYSYEVDVGLIRKGLRDESNKKTYNVAILLGDKAGRLKMDKEQLG